MSFEPSAAVSATSPAEHGTAAQVVRFLVVGALSYLVDITVLWLTVRQLAWPIVLGTTVAFGCAFVVNYGLGRRWVFRTSARRGPQVIRYGITVGLNYVLTLIAVTSLTALGVDLLIAKTISVAANAVVNYVLGRYWIYR